VGYLVARVHAALLSPSARAEIIFLIRFVILLDDDPLRETRPTGRTGSNLRYADEPA
jgi:hypothetical protein